VRGPGPRLAASDAPIADELRRIHPPVSGGSARTTALIERRASRCAAPRPPRTRKDDPL